MNLVNIFALLAFISGITSVTLSVIVLLNGKRDKIKFIFSFLTLCLGWWSISYFLWMSSNIEKYAYFWVGMLNIGSTFIPIAYYHWITVLLNKKRTKFLICGYAISFLFSLFSFSHFYFEDLVEIGGFLYWPQAGPLYIYYIFIIYFGFYFLSISELYLAISREKFTKNQKSILKIIFGAFSISLAAGATNFPLWFGIEILPYGNFILIFVHVFLISYAMVKYNFMEMKLLYTQLFTGLILIISLINIFLSSSNSEILLEVFIFIILLGFSYILIKSSKDETRKKEELFKLSNELKRANIELKRLDKAKSEFISIASHQLRTPLTAIKGYISLILEGAYGKDEDRKEEAFNKIFLANERLIQLVEDLLNITRIESGRLELHLEDKVQVEEIVEELRDMFILRAQEKNLDFVVETADKLLSPIKADRAKLREVISNLIDNAIKYTKEGFVHVSMEEDNGMIRVIVEDSGMGISEESMKTLFTKFSRGTDSSKIYTEGTGLGLYVGRNLVESQGGRVYAESEGVGKGSRFIVEMPMQRNK
ncbi:MAG: hypothetical protein CR972_01705 [Candidatus Moraniibacteriota bacterium]|nr:MAG: hypothetical protein CR972_01705 [Candidatus Moranbacteria bacterium]